MRIVKASFLPLILVAFGASASFAAEDFSAKKWGRQVSRALEAGDSEKLVPLVKWSEIQTNLFVKKDSSDKKTMHEARELFEKAKFEGALEKYGKIKKGSDYWFEAVEEKGWAFHRQKSYDKALAQTKTLLSPPFVSIVGAEPFFLQSLSQLKICDYKGIFETHKLFKSTQKARMVELQAIAENTTPVKIDKLVQKADSFPMAFNDIGEEAKLLPRLFYRDLELQKAMFVLKLAQVASEMSTLDIRSANMRQLRDDLTAQLKAEAVKAMPIVRARLAKLADVETEENAKMLQKINLIEIETIQRVHTDQELNKNAYAKGEFKKTTTEDLVFPDDGHPWMDELDKYQVKVNSCPSNVRRMM